MTEDAGSFPPQLLRAGQEGYSEPYPAHRPASVSMTRACALLSPFSFLRTEIEPGRFIRNRAGRCFWRLNAGGKFGVCL